MKRKEVEKVAREAYKSARLSSLGIEIVVAILFGSLMGYWADSYFGSEPAGLLLGMLVGFFAAIRSVNKTLRYVAEADEMSSKLDEKPVRTAEED